MRSVEIVATATLWGLFTAWLVFPLMGAARVVHRGVVLLLWAELISLLAWSYGSEGCAQRPCGPLTEVARAAAGEDVPALSAVLLALAVMDGLRRRRRGRGPCPSAISSRPAPRKAARSRPATVPAAAAGPAAAGPAAGSRSPRRPTGCAPL